MEMEGTREILIKKEKFQDKRMELPMEIVPFSSQTFANFAAETFKRGEIAFSLKSNWYQTNKSILVSWKYKKKKKEEEEDAWV